VIDRTYSPDAEHLLETVGDRLLSLQTLHKKEPQHAESIVFCIFLLMDEIWCVLSRASGKRPQGVYITPGKNHRKAFCEGLEAYSELMESAADILKEGLYQTDNDLESLREDYQAFKKELTEGMLPCFPIPRRREREIADRVIRLCTRILK